MTLRLVRAARLLAAILAVYGFLLHGFERDAIAVAKLSPDKVALCLPGAATHGAAGDPDATKACDLHCLGATAGAITPAGSPDDATLLRQPIRVAMALPVGSEAGWPLLRLSAARGPPRVI